MFSNFIQGFFLFLKIEENFSESKDVADNQLKQAALFQRNNLLREHESIAKRIEICIEETTLYMQKIGNFEPVDLEIPKSDFETIYKNLREILIFYGDKGAFKQIEMAQLETSRGLYSNLKSPTAS